ncbi:MAG: hypothetical protein U0R26_10730 [Solirubrobacterales bacterium]
MAMAREAVVSRAPVPSPLEAAKAEARLVPFGPVLALTLALAIGGLILLAIPIHELFPEVKLEPVYPNHHQSAETLTFALALLVVLPLALYLVPRLADRILAAAGPEGLEVVAATTSFALLAALVVANLLERQWVGGGPFYTLGLVAAWAVGAAVLLSRAAAGEELPATLQRSSGRAIWLGSACLLVVLMAGLAYLESITLAVALIGVAVTGAFVYAWDRVEVPRFGRRAGLGFDAAIVVLILLAVPNVVIFRVNDPHASLETLFMQFHQNLFLGPANHVIGGGTMLVDTFSQYGAGAIYLVAGWLSLVGTTNGMLGLLDGMLTACVFAGAYLVVRAGGVRRPLATGGMIVAILALAYGLEYPVGGLLQHGAIRFGIPMLILLGAAVESRRQFEGRLGLVIQLLAVALSSIWAFEAFGYTVITYAGVAVMIGVTAPGGGRRRYIGKRLLAAVAACLAAHVAFALATLLVSGQLPDWIDYGRTVGAFLFGTVGEITYDFSSWSPGFGLGIVYLASVSGLVLVLRRRPALARELRGPLVLIGGTTAYGLALFTYLVNRSADHIIAYVSLPALMIVLLWLGLVLRRRDAVPRDARLTAMAVTLLAGTLLVAVSWSSVGSRFGQSALAYVAPGGQSLGAPLSYLSDTPELSVGAEAAERLLEEQMPGEHESLVMIKSDTGVEALARTGRVNALPLSDPWEDSLVPEQRLPALDAVLPTIEPGTKLLISTSALRATPHLRRVARIQPSDWRLLGGRAWRGGSDPT